MGKEIVVSARHRKCSGAPVPLCKDRRAPRSNHLLWLRSVTSGRMLREKPTLADFMAANDTRDPVSLAPPPRHVRSKCNSNSLCGCESMVMSSRTFP